MTHTFLCTYIGVWKKTHKILQSVCCSTVDTSAAERLPGVVCCLFADSVPGSKITGIKQDETVFADGQVGVLPIWLIRLRGALEKKKKNICLLSGNVCGSNNRSGGGRQSASCSKSRQGGENWIWGAAACHNHPGKTDETETRGLCCSGNIYKYQISRLIDRKPSLLNPFMSQSELFRTEMLRWGLSRRKRSLRVGMVSVMSALDSSWSILMTNGLHHRWDAHRRSRAFLPGDSCHFGRSQRRWRDGAFRFNAVSQWHTGEDILGTVFFCQEQFGANFQKYLSRSTLLAHVSLSVSCS